MNTLQYTTEGTCARSITVSVDEAGIITDVVFDGGCHGNTQGVAALVRGMHADEAVRRLEGIDCRGKGTSCPDQLARALKALSAEK